MVHVASQAEVKQNILRYVSEFEAGLLEVMWFCLYSGGIMPELGSLTK